MGTGPTRAFARKWSEATIMRWEISSDRFQAKVCQHHGASERKRSESCKVTSIIHMSSERRRRRVFLQTVAVVTLVELCIDRVKLKGVCVCVCMRRLVRVCHFHHIRKFYQTDPNLAERMSSRQHACLEDWRCHWFPNSEFIIIGAADHIETKLTTSNQAALSYQALSQLVVCSYRAWLRFRGAGTRRWYICNIACK